MLLFWVGLLFTSCKKPLNVYSVSITNQFVEPLYNCQLGSIEIDDTLNVNQSSPSKLISKGNYIFSTVSQSGLMLTANVAVQGDNSNIKLAVDENGKLVFQ